MSVQYLTLLLLVCASLNLTWLIVFRKLDNLADSPEFPAKPLTLPEWADLRDSTLAWLDRHRLEATVLVGGMMLAFLIVLTAPTPEPGFQNSLLYGLHLVRGSLPDIAPVLAPIISIVTATLSLLFFALAQRNRRTAAASAGLLIAALGLAGLGQLALSGYYGEVFSVPYTLAIVFMIAWAIGWGRYQVPVAARETPVTWIEVGLLILVLAVTVLARFHRVGELPYGIEGDEGKWTVEVVQIMVDGSQALGAEYHFNSVPVSFLMQSLFHRALGPSIESARLAVASFSVLASLVFYWLVRQIAGPVVAFLAAFLLAISIFDITASRLANVESHVKLWPILALALLLLASRRSSLLAYLLAGLAVALGMLTYDTVWPLVVIAPILAVYDLARRRVPLRNSLRYLTAFLVPPLLAAPVSTAYFSGRFQYYGVETEWQTDFFSLLGLHARDLLDVIFARTYGDFLYNRPGPLINALLLPWLVLGTVLIVANWRRGRLLWILVFAALFFAPVPILTNQPAGRVLYPGLAALYAIIAIGMIAAFREVSRGVGPNWRPVMLGMAGVVLIYLTAVNLFIHFNEVRDFGDRWRRRELYEIARSTAGEGRMTYYPYVPHLGDPLEHEADFIIWLGYRAEAELGGSVLPYRSLTLDLLQDDLRQHAMDYDRVEVVWNTEWPVAAEVRAEALDRLLACYPGSTRIRLEYFDRYILDTDRSRATEC